jgi:hypothetical protein
MSPSLPPSTQDKTRSADAQTEIRLCAYCRERISPKRRQEAMSGAIVFTIRTAGLKPVPAGADGAYTSPAALPAAEWLTAWPAPSGAQR